MREKAYIVLRDSGGATVINSYYTEPEPFEPLKNISSDGETFAEWVEKNFEKKMREIDKKYHK